MPGLTAFAQRLTESGRFQGFIIGLIILNGIAVGMETWDSLASGYHDWFVVLYQVVLVAFIAEALLKMMACWPRPFDYFKSGWNCFDFVIILLSIAPDSGELAMLARLARLFRVLRLISAFPELRLIVDTLLRSLPSMGHVAILLCVLFYIYAVAGFYLFHDVDPTHWKDLPIALLSLFRIVTLEDWTDIMYTAMAAKPWAWVYFVSFVVLGTFVMINLFIAVVLNNLDEAKAEKLRQLRTAPTHDEILKELRDTQDALARLHVRLEASGVAAAQKEEGTLHAVND
ncbi:ion transporter [Porticoccus sp. W117]|uniref:ion transporter n=1 Tax=Porticoccus sp. W117 TaxID=3054777 RepID=UPI002591C7EF|nr:ion transporter [Porticoccus sp. W117]MDM3870567.1 ion transporter [Porticoccus sp. W117]